MLNLKRTQVRVLDNRALSPTAFELTLERGDIQFEAGQLLTIHGRHLREDRSYTIASGEGDDVLQVLYRLIPSGQLTPQLALLRAGDPLEISAPYGEFTLRDPDRPLVFVATGTGVAPYRSFLRTHHGLKTTLIHGVRTVEDLFYRGEFARAPYHPCVTSGGPGVFQGRVTSFFASFAFAPDAHFYLCGANEMFYDMRDLLLARGVSALSIFTEAYYYHADD